MFCHSTPVPLPNPRQNNPLRNFIDWPNSRQLQCLSGRIQLGLFIFTCTYATVPSSNKFRKILEEVFIRVGPSGSYVDITSLSPAAFAAIPARTRCRCTWHVSQKCTRTCSCLYPKGVVIDTVTYDSETTYLSNPVYSSWPISTVGIIRKPSNSCGCAPPWPFVSLCPSRPITYYGTIL